MAQKEINILCFTDDTVIIAQNEDKLQIMLCKFSQFAEKYNMHVPLSKTNTMSTSKEPLRFKLSLNNKNIIQVMTFNYLKVIALI